MGQRNWFAVHFPGQQGVGHCLHGYRALDHHAFRIDSFRQLFAASTCHVGHALVYAPQCLDHCAHRYAAPDHAASSPHLPGGATRLGWKQATTIARALQDHRHRLQPHRFEILDREGTRILYAFNRHCPSVTIGDDRGVRRRQIVADIELIGRCDDAGTECAALGLQRAGGMHNHRVCIFPAHVRR